MQEDLKYFEAKEDDVVAYEAEEFYAGGGQFSRTGGQEHFPQLWCRNGTYSLNGQVQPSCCDTANSSSGASQGGYPHTALLLLSQKET